MPETTATGEVGLPREVKQYETEYGFEIRDPDELYEVARLLVSEPDFLYGRVLIGTTEHEYTSSGPRLVVKPEGLFYEQTCHVLAYGWECLTSSAQKRRNLTRLIQEYVNPGFKFSSWKVGKLVDKDNNVVAELREGTGFTYQFSDDEISKEEFIRELREALLLQQIILSETEKDSRSLMGFSSGVTVGNPYLYSGGKISFFPEHKSYLKEELPAMDKFRRHTDEYLMRRIPDIDEARRIISTVLPEYEAERLRVRALESEIHKLTSKPRHRSHHWADSICEMREEIQGMSYEGSCRLLGIDPEVFGRLGDEDIKRFLERQRAFWAKIYHPEVRGGGDVSKMVEVNKAADFLKDSRNRNGANFSGSAEDGSDN